MKVTLIQTVDAQVKLEEAEAKKQEELNQAIRESFDELASDNQTTGNDLYEAVTHVLANIAAAAGEGQPIKAMNASTLAAFLAGVDHIAKVLPRANQTQHTNALKALRAAAIGPDGLITTQCAPIANVGAKQLDLSVHYGDIVKGYVAASNAGKADGRELVQAVRQLQAKIDQAMRVQPAPTKFSFTRPAIA